MKPTHEQKLRQRAKKRRQAEAAEKHRRTIEQEAKAAGLSVRDYQFMRLMDRILGPLSCD